MYVFLLYTPYLQPHKPPVLIRLFFYSEAPALPLADILYVHPPIPDIRSFPLVQIEAQAQRFGCPMRLYIP